MNCLYERHDIALFNLKMLQIVSIFTQENRGGRVAESCRGNRKFQPIIYRLLDWTQYTRSEFLGAHSITRNLGGNIVKVFHSPFL